MQRYHFRAAPSISLIKVCLFVPEFRCNFKYFAICVKWSDSDDDRPRGKGKKGSKKEGQSDAPPQKGGKGGPKGGDPSEDGPKGGPKGGPKKKPPPPKKMDSGDSSAE